MTASKLHRENQALCSPIFTGLAYASMLFLNKMSQKQHILCIKALKRYKIKRFREKVLDRRVGMDILIL